MKLKPMTFLEPRDDPAGDGVGRVKTIGIVRPLEGNGRWGHICHDDVGLRADQLRRECSYPIGITAAPSKFHPQVAALGPTQARKALE